MILLNTKICIVMAILLIIPLVSMNAFGAGTLELKSYNTTIDPKSTILILGTSSGLTPYIPIKLTVTDPSGKLIYSPNIKFESDGTFKYQIQPPIPQFTTGTYTVEASHQDLEVPVIIQFQVLPVGSATSGSATSSTCTANQLSAQGKCIQFSINGATVSSSSIDTNTKAIVVMLSNSNQGSLNIKPSTDIIKGISTVLVDGKASRNVVINGNDVTVSFPPGTQKIEFIGTYVIPEFGQIAMIILVMSIAGIVFMTGKYKVLGFPKI
jgi:predicted secreted protein with PEFG-CTERM motif